LVGFLSYGVLGSQAGGAPVGFVPSLYQFNQQAIFSHEPADSAACKRDGWFGLREEQHAVLAQVVDCGLQRAACVAKMM